MDKNTMSFTKYRNFNIASQSVVNESEKFVDSIASSPMFPRCRFFKNKVVLRVLATLLKL